MSHLSARLESMTRLASPVFVGRAVELARLERALWRAADGDGASVIIGGEAGVGKTRLVEELAARAAAAGHTMLVGGCVELEGDGLPLAPVVEALRGLARRIGPDALARLAGGRRDELARLLPELTDPTAPAAPAPADGVQRGGIGRLFDLVLGVVEALSAERPVLFVIEDLHWADHSTRSLAAFLLRNLRGLRATLVLTYRADGVGPGHPLRTFLAESERLRWVAGSEQPRWVDRMELARFGRAEVTELVTAILGEAPGDDLVDTVMARSDGNAFFVEELVCAAGDGGVDTISPTLREALLARVEALPAATRHLLRVAAAGGQRVEHRLLAAVMGLPEEQLWDALRAAVAAGVLMVPADDAYCFRHALTRGALRDEALPGELSHLHRRYAQALEADPGLVGAPRAAAAVAYHWYAACDHVRALPALLTAARAAAGTYAFAEALRHYERALASWDQVPDAAKRAGMDYLGVLEAAIAVAKLAGELRRGLDLAVRARAEASLLGDPVRLALVLTEQSFLLRMLGHSDGVAEAREAVRVMPVEPPTPTRAKVLVSLGKALSMVPRRAAALEAIEEALAIARATGARQVEGKALLTTACLASSWILPEDARLGRAIAQELGDDDLLLASYTNESDTWLGGCRFGEAVAVGREGLRLARRFGQERTHGGLIIAGNVVEALFGAGRWEEAEELLAETTELAPMGLHALFLDQLRGELALARGRLDGAAAALAAAEGTLAHRYLGSQYTMPLLRLRLELDVRRAEPGALTDGVAAALAAVRAIESLDFADVIRYAAPLVAAAMSAAAEAASVARALRAGDDLRHALDVAATVAALAAEMPFERAVTGEACRAVLAGELARAEGRPDPEPWASATKAWAALGVPYHAAQARHRRAEALLAVGDRSAAGHEARAAAAAAETLGAHLLSRDLRLLAAQGRLALRDPAGEAPAADGDGRASASAVAGGPPLGLTARELDVLRLVAAGSTNPQIAAALFISRKTASTHVSNILGKLGVTTRGEAAAVAHRLRLFDAADAVAPGNSAAG